MKIELVSKAVLPATSQKILRSSVERYRHLRSTDGYPSSLHALTLPHDRSCLRAVDRILSHFHLKKLRVVLLIGIGGSNLGAKAIYDALRGHTHALRPDRYPRLICADTCSPTLLADIQSYLDQHVDSSEQILINIVSKSGNTTETIANADILLNSLARRFPDIQCRVIITTDEGSALWKRAEEQGMAHVSLPHRVGGRYSVFSAVGLLPLRALGLDVKALLSGARSVDSDWAMKSAGLIYQSFRRGMFVNDFFTFEPELATIGSWLRQLTAESLGKEYDLKGKHVRTGMLPTVSVGSIDLHSVAQLYLGGPKNRFTTFVSSRASHMVQRVSSTGFLSDLVSGIAGRTSQDIMWAIQKGVETAYQAHHLPFIKVELSRVDEKNIGMFMQWKMMEVAFLADLMGINAFDQPNVEDYKKITRSLLSFPRRRESSSNKILSKIFIGTGSPPPRG